METQECFVSIDELQRAMSLSTICNTLKSACKVYCCRNLNKFRTSQQIFGEVSNIKFRENPSSGASLIHSERQTDRRNVID